ncbi:HI0074 family nucleotidyltransferase substrate-binding subunit [Thiohalorhabdus sp.]|uniref:HI0074 family nucleotidyltransferase substrate-binding subunit n=1 Tax=Thiohalorhabdus sp. TaxID=3094134 RepID=UPI002FC35358
MRFGEALDAPETDLNQGAIIQRPDFCFELAWKAIQIAAPEEGLTCSSPKGCLRVAFQQRWLDDEQTWLATLEDRNRTSHAYHEEFARQLYGRLANYRAPLSRLAACLRDREDRS